ncbi:MAG: universal stress protein [Desulfobacterales bacterium]
MILPEVTIKKILYATDLSPNAFYAFAYAVSLANLYGATILILHVLTEIPNLDSALQDYIGSEKWNEIKDRNIKEIKDTLAGKKRGAVAIREALDQFYEDVKNQSEQSFEADEIMVKRGNTVDVILEQSVKRNCDLIVMGTHGHGILSDVMMGSTTRKVLRKSLKPVLVVRLPESKAV